MSSHHGHHRSSHHSRSRMHHSSSSHYSSMQRSRTGSSNTLSDSVNNSISSHRNNHQDHGRETSTSCDWQEHKSSTGKVYYYNPRTGVSQWEVPQELRQQQAQPQAQPQQLQQQQQQQSQLQQQQQERLGSPESELSESSSIRQQENSPSSSASSHRSNRSESVIEDKPLLTPSLFQYFKPELIVNFNSSQQEELQNQSNQLDREILLLNERLLKERVEIAISKSNLEHATTQVEAHETKCTELRRIIERFGILSYQ
ncbi:WW domain-containing adapter with coiled-coil-like isoform X2 [Olea europaea subsp. europaea]|uniref:WW domain-containing adapter with coiled-coil-like isoform X2 n=1 Tax=Olea europaea subsp. europaea TaxID=158383 RepID=A0A8S0VNY2_OLEEU|nr:WW domain-containing adapter with coiled-coil-like isoform X2 [Olea europaea subsp. europaea]